MKKAFIYFLLTGACILPAFYIHYEVDNGWIKYGLGYALFVLGIYFSMKQMEHMGKRKTKPTGFIYTDPQTDFQVYMDQYKGTFHDLSTHEELGTFEGLQNSLLDGVTIQVSFDLTFYSPEKFKEALTIKK